MREYGKIAPGFWIGTTGKSMRGDPTLQVVATYLVTSPHATMIGVYHCPITYLSHDTGIPFEGASKALRRLEELGFCSYDHASEEIFVIRMAAYQIGTDLSPKDKRCAGIAKQLQGVSSSLLRRSFFATYSRAFHLPATLPDTDKITDPDEAPSKPLRSQEQEQEQEQEQDAGGPPSAPDSQAVITIPLIGDGQHAVTQGDIDAWSQTYPAVDVQQQLAEMRAWSQANTVNRKTPRGINKFIVGWLAREQDKGSKAGSVASITVPAKAGVDPALAKIEADDKRAAPMPAAVRARLAELRGRPIQ